MRAAVLAAIVLAGCKADDLVEDLPDADVAQPDAVDLPSGYDWSCVGEAWPTEAPGTLRLEGGVFDSTSSVGGVVVDVLDAETSAVLGTTTSSSSVLMRGHYAVDLATGGVAPKLVRRTTALGRVDGYYYDPAPTTAMFQQAGLTSFTTEEYGNYHASMDVTVTDGTALVGAYIYDCAGTVVEGATVEVLGAETVMYGCADHTYGDACADLTATTTDGGFLAANVPPGEVDILVQLDGYTYPSHPVRVVADAFIDAPRFPGGHEDTWDETRGGR